MLFTGGPRFRWMDLLPLQTADTDTFQFERLLLGRGFTRIAGTDEAGRGPLAGPVVAAAVILPPACDYRRFCDSKTTTERQRLQLRDQLHSIGARIGVGMVDSAAIDRLNILQASLLAMRRAVEHLVEQSVAPDFLLVDGKFTVPLDLPQQALVKGDSRSATIGAASIIAKLERDTIMAGFHEQYPDYNFAANKGYPTTEHRAAVKRHGPSPVHRLTFRGVREFV